MKKKRSGISYRDLGSQGPAGPVQPPEEAPAPRPAPPAAESAPEPPAPAPPRRRRTRAPEAAASSAPEAAASSASEAAAAPVLSASAAPAEALPATAGDPLAAASAVAERIAALDTAAETPTAGDGEDAATEPRLPLRERVRLRAGVAQLLLFRVGTEWFATDLAAAEEAIELPQVHHVPEMPESMIGMFDLRGRMLPVYAPARVLGVPLRSAAAATLVLRGGEHRVGIAVDDVEDVFTVDLAQLRDLPASDDADGVVLGVARYGRDLVAVLDAEALVAACLSDRVMESV